MNETYLAHIQPTEPYSGKIYAQANILFISGKHEGKTITANVKTDIYRHYFFGTTLEAVTVDDDMNIVDVFDADLKLMHKLGLGMSIAVAYNSSTTDLLAQNGKVYNLQRSKFNAYCPYDCNNIISMLGKCFNTILCVYTLNGEVVNVVCNPNVIINDQNKNYVLQFGMVTMNTNLLSKLSEKKTTSVTHSNNDPLTQKEIDELLEQLNWSSL